MCKYVCIDAEIDKRWNTITIHYKCLKSRIATYVCKIEKFFEKYMSLILTLLTTAITSKPEIFAYFAILLLSMSIIFIVYNLTIVVSILLIVLSLPIVLWFIILCYMNRATIFTIRFTLTKLFPKNVTEGNVFRDVFKSYDIDTKLDDLTEVNIVCKAFEKYRKVFEKIYGKDVEFIEIMCNIVKHGKFNSIDELNDLLYELLQKAC